MTLDALLASIDASQVSLAVMTVLVLGVVASWHEKKPGFDLSDSLVDTTTGKVSPEKIGYMVVLALMSWGFVALILTNRMTEWFAGLYGGMFVMGRIGYKWADAKKESQNVKPPDQQ
jgi:hypothetical protein